MSKEHKARFTYVGPNSSLHLVRKDADAVKVDDKVEPIPLITGKTYPGKGVKALPADHPVVVSLIERRLLIRVDDEASDATDQDEKSNTTPSKTLAK